MNKLPKAICNFIKKHHIVNIAAHNQKDFWAASCFYSFDEEKVRLIIMTKTTTRHGILMQENHRIVGTIAKQTSKIKEIEGIQFKADANLLKNDEQKVAFDLYSERQPLAKLISSDIWEIVLTEIKYTSNKLVFANKINWVRDEIC